MKRKIAAQPGFDLCRSRRRRQLLGTCANRRMSFLGRQLGSGRQASDTKKNSNYRSRISALTGKPHDFHPRRAAPAIRVYRLCAETGQQGVKKLSAAAHILIYCPVLLEDYLQPFAVVRNSGQPAVCCAVPLPADGLACQFRLSITFLPAVYFNGNLRPPGWIAPLM